MFACNAPFHIPSSWQPTHDSILSPPVPQPSMAYVQQLDSKAYNHNLPPFMTVTGPLKALPDMQQTVLGKSSPPYNNSRDGCPLIDFSIDDDSNRPKRGPFKDVADRVQTAQTRKDNACIRCKMQRTRVRSVDYHAT